MEMVGVGFLPLHRILDAFRRSNGKLSPRHTCGPQIRRILAIFRNCTRSFVWA
jgi:hypothetical protein